MKTLRWNGEYWYVDQRSLWKRVRQWIIWVGGWEKANGAGWQMRITYASGRRGWMSPTPISLCGHRVTFFGHWLDFRVPSGVCVVSFRDRLAYVSRDGTPNQAHHWLWGVDRRNGAPYEATQVWDAARRVASK